MLTGPIVEAARTVAWPEPSKAGGLRLRPGSIADRLRLLLPRSLAAKKVKAQQAAARQSSFEEAFRLLALHVERQKSPNQMHSVLVMGGYAGDGRTTTVCNLGLALARRGRRVLLVESDFHKPELAKLLQLEFATPDWDSPNISLTVASAAVPGLLVARPTPGGASEPASFLSALRPLADFIILDSAPCLSHAESFFWASHVDGILYVIRRRPQDVGRQRYVQEQLTQLGAKMLGVVYNERPSRWSGRPRSAMS